MNPYLLPGLEDTPFAALCPHRNQGHEELYVPVDDTEGQYKHFQKAIRASRRLLTTGRLVVVTGSEGCGKTSLINRCAAWLTVRLADKVSDERGDLKMTGVIVSPTVVADSAVPIRRRMEAVAKGLVHELRNPGFNVDKGYVDALEKLAATAEELPENAKVDLHRAKMEDFYRYLGLAMGNDRVAIILLPPSDDLVGEIENYARLAQFPQLIFFAETSFTESLRHAQLTATTNDSIPPVVLTVGPLGEDDSWLYANTRQEANPEAKYPWVTEDTIQSVTKDATLSIGWLHQILYGVTERFEPADGEATPVAFELTPAHFAKYCMDIVFGRTGNLL